MNKPHRDVKKILLSFSGNEFNKLKQVKDKNNLTWEELLLSTIDTKKRTRMERRE
jgi:hypothetical protein